MGNDGGSIPKRRELVKNAARAPTVSELKATALESLAHAWTHCALSGSQLDVGAVVSDWRGRLYNYEAILRGLMPSDEPAETTPSTLGIQSLRDIQRLKFHSSGDNWTCPISMKELGPATKAVYLVPCGHVFAEVAINEIKAKVCPECGEELKEENTITILPTTEKDTVRLEQRIESLRGNGLTHSLKKDKSEKKKKRKGKDVREEDGDTNNTEKQNENGDRPPKQEKTNGDARISGINNPMAASLTARVLAEQDDQNKRRKLATGGMLRKSEVTKS